MTGHRLDAFVAAWARCDLDALGDYLANDVVFSSLDGRTARGRAAVVRRFAHVLASESDCCITFEPAQVCGAIGTCRWHLEGETPDGAAFRVDGVDVYEFEGDRILAKDVYRKP
jgi:ketosteroid isomerase-like protein